MAGGRGYRRSPAPEVDAGAFAAYPGLDPSSEERRPAMKVTFRIFLRLGVASN
jgi:hypothetical protein